MTETADLEEEIQMLRREREQLGVQLLDLQRQVASAATPDLERREREGDMVEEELRRQIGALEAEIAAIRGTLTWKVSAPARKVRQYLRRS
jgi:hypothetical protein